MKKVQTKDIVLCALFAALSAVLSQVSIPIGPAPINFVHFAIFTAAGIIGAKRATLSQIIFVLIGLTGIPVFSGFAGGIGIILSPRGGFILGYIFCAFVVGLIIDRFGKSIKVLLFAMLAGWVVTYTFGIPWFMYFTEMSFVETSAFMSQFIPGDIAKTVLSIVVVRRLGDVLMV